MAASKYDFVVEQGASYKLSLKYKDDQDNPISLVNYCARLVWKTSAGTTQTFLSSDVENPNYKFYIDTDNSLIVLLLSANYTNS